MAVIAWHGCVWRSMNDAHTSQTCWCTARHAKHVLCRSRERLLALTSSMACRAMLSESTRVSACLAVQACGTKTDPHAASSTRRAVMQTAASQQSDTCVHTFLFSPLP
eukprot:361630-Chlamydomonas_euryale.AAC.8